MFKYWRGDGCHGIGYETLCRFIPILYNFFSGNHLLPSNHKETQPFLPAVQRSADGSSNSLKSTQPHTINQAPEQPSYPSRPEKPAREASLSCASLFPQKKPNQPHHSQFSFLPETHSPSTQASNFPVKTLLKKWITGPKPKAVTSVPIPTTPPVR